MIATTFKIPYKWGETIKIRPFFDAHLGHSQSDSKAIKKFLSGDAYYFCGGDLTDSVIVRDPRYSKKGDITESDEVVDEQVDIAADLLRPLADNGRLMGVGMGNHEQTVLKHSGSNITRRVAKRLGVPSLGIQGFIKLILSEKKARSRTVIIRWHHGYGGNFRTLGGLLTKYDREMIYYDADVYMFGHNHRQIWGPVDRLRMTGKKNILSTKVHLMCCGSFKKIAEISDIPSWEETRGFLPTSVGGLTLNIKPTKEWVNMWVSDQY